MSEPILTLAKLSKTFDRLTAVDNIDLQVKKGEILGFVNPAIHDDDSYMGHIDQLQVFFYVAIQIPVSQHQVIDHL